MKTYLGQKHNRVFDNTAVGFTGVSAAMKRHIT